MPIKVNSGKEAAAHEWRLSFQFSIKAFAYDREHGIVCFLWPETTLRLCTDFCNATTNIHVAAAAQRLICASFGASSRGLLLSN